MLRRSLALVVAGLSLAGCVADAQTADDIAAEEADSTAAKYTYRCTATSNGTYDVMWIRVSKTKIISNETKSFTAAGGATVMKHDPGYVSKSKTPYVRYVHEDGTNMYTEWKVEPEMVKGGRPMKSGDLGGFAIMGAKGDWYGSESFVCFRSK